MSITGALAIVEGLAKVVPTISRWVSGDKPENAVHAIAELAITATGAKSLESANAAILTDPEMHIRFQEALLTNSTRLDELAMENTKDARKMQTAALESTSWLAQNFVYMYAMALTLATMIYVACATFMTVPTANVRFVDTVLGFLMGTVLATIIGFFYGSAHRKAPKPLKPDRP